MTNGLLMINTGHGKGKTTAALGLALRAAGHGHRVCFIQFIKGSWKYGELEAIKRFGDLIDFKVMGRGFTWKSEDLEKDKAVAREAWDLAKAAILSGGYHLVVLDEFTYVMNFGMVEPDAVLEVLRSKPPALHVLITGRDAPAALVAAADLVTEMQPVKHPFTQGVKAQKGVEF